MKNWSYGKLYSAGKIKYIYENKVNGYRGRPVLMVEVVEVKDSKVTFLTDYPVEEITLDEDLFNEHFHRRRW
jgi:hypothetical protein